jgi:hypothetical protein
VFGVRGGVGEGSVSCQHNTHKQMFGIRNKSCQVFLSEFMTPLTL